VTYVTSNGVERNLTLQARRLTGLLLNLSLAAWLYYRPNSRRTIPSAFLALHALQFSVLEQSISSRCAALLVRPEVLVFPFPLWFGEAFTTAVLPSFGFGRRTVVALTLARALLLPLFGSRLSAKLSGPLWFRFESEALLTAAHCAIAIAALKLSRHQQ
jgi:hypothetical protein